MHQTSDIPKQCGPSLSMPTSAVLGTDGVTVEARGAPLAVGPGSVSPAVLAVARHVVALVENQVGVRITVAVAPFTGTTSCHWIAIVTWRTSGWEKRQITDTVLYVIHMYYSSLWPLKQQLKLYSACSHSSVTSSSCTCCIYMKLII